MKGHMKGQIGGLRGGIAIPDLLIAQLLAGTILLIACLLALIYSLFRAFGNKEKRQINILGRVKISSHILAAYIVFLFIVAALMDFFMQINMRDPANFLIRNKLNGGAELVWTLQASILPFPIFLLYVFLASIVLIIFSKIFNRIRGR